MPERDTPGQSGGSTEQGARVGEWGAPEQGSAPGQEQFGTSASGEVPGQPGPGQPGGQRAGQPSGEWAGQQGGQPSGQQAGQRGGQWAGQQGGQPSGQWAGQQGGQWTGQPATTPVAEAETRVTWRRIFQYWIDAFFVSVIPYLASIPFDRSTSTIMNIIGGVVYVVLFVLIGLWYWVIRPHSHNGQTFAMKWFDLRVISKDGGPANLLQLFVRWISLLFDSAPWMWPFTGLLGLIVMLCSRHRQRIGDHLARTLVIRTASARFGGAGGPGGYGRAGTEQPGTVESGTEQPGTVGHKPGAGQETGTRRDMGAGQETGTRQGMGAGQETGTRQDMGAGQQPDAGQAGVTQRGWQRE